MANSSNNLVNDMSMRQKLQNSKGYSWGYVFSRKSLSLQLEVNYIPSSLDYKKKMNTHIYIYTDTKPITLPCLLTRVGKKRENNSCFRYGSEH